MDSVVWGLVEVAKDGCAVDLTSVERAEVVLPGVSIHFPWRLENRPKRGERGDEELSAHFVVWDQVGPRAEPDARLSRCSVQRSQHSNAGFVRCKVTFWGFLATFS
jgi:hypothetical protein